MERSAQRFRQRLQRRWKRWFGKRKEAFLAWWRERRVDQRHVLGRQGEKAAIRHLRRSGMRILYRNYRPAHGGEIDAVCREGDILVFVEIKTRTDDAFGAPAEAVGPAKQQLIARGAQSWLRLLGNPPINYRFDIVEVILPPGGKPACNLIRNAFPLPEYYRD